MADETPTPPVDNYDKFKDDIKTKNIIDRLDEVRQEFIGTDEDKFRRADNAYRALTLL